MNGTLGRQDEKRTINKRMDKLQVTYACMQYNKGVYTLQRGKESDGTRFDSCMYVCCNSSDLSHGEMVKVMSENLSKIPLIIGC